MTPNPYTLCIAILLIGLAGCGSSSTPTEGPNGSAGGSHAGTSVTFNGVTWTLDATYQVGWFLDDTPYVVANEEGRVGIIEIDPPTQEVSGKWIVDPSHGHNDLRWINGSMVDPEVGNSAHGLDSALFWTYHGANYDHSLNVAAQLPFDLLAGQTLISTISTDTIDENDTQSKRAIDYGAILTCLGEAPPVNSFRPPYHLLSGKHVVYTHDDLQAISVLPRLTIGSNGPGVEDVVNGLPGLCYGDHLSSWMKQSAAAQRDCNMYGREYATDVGQAAAFAVSDVPDADKQRVVYRLVQRGLELYSIITNGGQHNFMNNGGHHHGRFFPVIFAGYMLNNADMQSIGETPTVDLYFGEDQFFSVQETSPGQYNDGHGGYLATDVGLPEWGIRHGTEPSSDDRSWSASYRQCCTANSTYGQHLAALALGMESLFRSEAAFDYQSRYFQCQQLTEDYGSLFLATSSFQRDMWADHAHTFRAPWAGLICP